MRSAEWWRQQTGRVGRTAGQGRRRFTAWQRPHAERTNTTRNGLAAAYSRSLTDAGRPALRAGGRTECEPAAATRSFKHRPHRQRHRQRTRTDRRGRRRRRSVALVDACAGDARRRLRRRRRLRSDSPLHRRCRRTAERGGGAERGGAQRLAARAAVGERGIARARTAGTAMAVGNGRRQRPSATAHGKGVGRAKPRPKALGWAERKPIGRGLPCRLYSELRPADRLTRCGHGGVLQGTHPHEGEHLRARAQANRAFHPPRRR